MDWNSTVGALDVKAEDRHEPPNKVRQVKVEDKESIGLRLGAVNAYDNRLTAACACRELNLAVSSEVVKFIQKAHGEYSVGTKGKKGHSHGAPDSWNFAGLLMVFGGSSDSGTAEYAKNLLQLYASGSKAAQRFVHFCRLEKAHVSTHKQLLLSLRSCDVEAKIIDLIVGIGAGTEWMGPKPAGFRS